MTSQTKCILLLFICIKAIAAYGGEEENYGVNRYNQYAHNSGGRNHYIPYDTGNHNNRINQNTRKNANGRNRRLNYDRNHQQDLHKAINNRKYYDDSYRTNANLRYSDPAKVEYFRNNDRFQQYNQKPNTESAYGISAQNDYFKQYSGSGQSYDSYLRAHEDPYANRYFRTNEENKLGSPPAEHEEGGLEQYTAQRGQSNSFFQQNVVNGKITEEFKEGHDDEEPIRINLRLRDGIQNANEYRQMPRDYDPNCPVPRISEQFPTPYDQNQHVNSQNHNGQNYNNLYTPNPYHNSNYNRNNPQNSHIANQNNNYQPNHPRISHVAHRNDHPPSDPRNPYLPHSNNEYLPNHPQNPHSHRNNYPQTPYAPPSNNNYLPNHMQNPNVANHNNHRPTTTNVNEWNVYKTKHNQNPHNYNLPANCDNQNNYYYQNYKRLTHNVSRLPAPLKPNEKIIKFEIRNVYLDDEKSKNENQTQQHVVPTKDGRIVVYNYVKGKKLDGSARRSFEKGDGPLLEKPKLDATELVAYMDNTSQNLFDIGLSLDDINNDYTNRRKVILAEKPSPIRENSHRRRPPLPNYPCPQNETIVFDVKNVGDGLLLNNQTVQYLIPRNFSGNRIVIYNYLLNDCKPPDGPGDENVEKPSTPNEINTDIPTQPEANTTANQQPNSDEITPKVAIIDTLPTNSSNDDSPVVNNEFSNTCQIPPSCTAIVDPDCNIVFANGLKMTVAEFKQILNEFICTPRNVKAAVPQTPEPQITPPPGSTDLKWTSRTVPVLNDTFPINVYIDGKMVDDKEAKPIGPVTSVCNNVESKKSEGTAGINKSCVNECENINDVLKQRTTLIEPLLQNCINGLMLSGPNSVYLAANDSKDSKLVTLPGGLNVSVAQFRHIISETISNPTKVKVTVPGGKCAPLYKYFENIDRSQIDNILKNGVCELSDGLRIPMSTIITSYDFYSWLVDQHKKDVISPNIPVRLINSSGFLHFIQSLIASENVNIIFPNNNYVAYSSDYLKRLSAAEKQNIYVQMLGYRMPLEEFEKGIQCLKEKIC